MYFQVTCHHGEQDGSIQRTSGAAAVWSAVRRYIAQCDVTPRASPCLVYWRRRLRWLFRASDGRRPRDARETCQGKLIHHVFIAPSVLFVSAIPYGMTCLLKLLLPKGYCFLFFVSFCGIEFFCLSIVWNLWWLAFMWPPKVFRAISFFLWKKERK